MSYPTLMVYIDPDEVSDQLCRVAAGIADKFSATLIGVSAIGIRPPFVAEGVVIEEVTDLQRKAIRTRLAEKERWFRDNAGKQAQKIDWRSALDTPVSVLVRESRAADLIIISQRGKVGDAYDSLDSGSVILKAGRPSLVVPDRINSLSANHIMVAWKDTRESRRALMDALPFLHEATRVTVVEICGSDDKEAGGARIDDVAQFLARHRIKANTRLLVHETSHGSHLLTFAKNEGADLLVSGAYGHSRLGEWIFGGVTYDLLALSQICCLMSH